MIYQILEQLSSTSSRNDKLSILQSNKDNVLLRDVLKAALDPTINYYIRKIPAVAEHKSELTLSEALTQLNKLTSREYTGNAASQFLEVLLTQLSERDADVLSKIIQHDLRAGINESTVNKVYPKLIPTFPYMRCSLPKHIKMDDIDWSKGHFSQVKADGMFANGTEFGISSRAGSEFPSEAFQEIIQDIKECFSGYVVNGELLIETDGKIESRAIGNGILNSVLKGGKIADNQRIIYEIWDAIPTEYYAPKGEYTSPYRERFDFIQSRVKNSLRAIESKIVYSFDEAYAHYLDCLDRGLEGTVIKLRDAIWIDGTSVEQFKMKLEAQVELEIFGFTEGRGKNKDLFGSIMCKSSCGALQVNVSGIKDDLRKHMHENREAYIGKIITVTSNAITFATVEGQPHRLFLPRFEEIREDKNEADSFERIKEIFESLIHK